MRMMPPAIASASTGVADVSIVVVNYNAGRLLGSCVHSCLEQSGQVVLVDNASIDRSIEEVVAKFGGDSRLHVIRNRANLGFAAACNLGADIATGRFVLFLNPDCTLETDAVSSLKRALEGAPQAGMAGALLVDEGGKEQAGGRRAVPTPWRSLVRALHLSRFADRWPRLFSDFNLHKLPLPEHPVEVESISGACTMVTRRAMADVGPWDDSYFLHCEDLDLCMRYRQRKWDILFVPGARIIHHRGACSRSRPIFVEWHKHHGMLRFYKKFFRHQYPGVLMWLVTLGVWLRFGAIAGLTLLMRIRPKATGKRDG